MTYASEFNTTPGYYFHHKPYLTHHVYIYFFLNIKIIY